MAKSADETVEPQLRADQLDGPSASAAPPSDEELARRAQSGSVASFGQLAERYEGRLLAYFRRRVGRDSAEDLAQETFIRSWSSLHRYDASRSFSTWVFTIASRLATDHYRAAGKNRRLLDRCEEMQHASPEQEPAHSLADETEHDVWTIAHRVLSREQVSAIWLRYVMEMRIEDLAAVLGKSRIATRVMLFRTRERLGAAIRNESAIDEAPVPSPKAEPPLLLQSRRSGPALSVGGAP